MSIYFIIKGRPSLFHEREDTRYIKDIRFVFVIPTATILPRYIYLSFLQLTTEISGAVYRLR